LGCVATDNSAEVLDISEHPFVLGLFKHEVDEVADALENTVDLLRSDRLFILRKVFEDEANDLW
jgi:hypothetical protein